MVAPLDDEELAKIRDIIKSQDRARWFYANMRIWATWISAFIVGTWAVLEVFGKFFKKLGSP